LCVDRLAASGAFVAGAQPGVEAGPVEGVAAGENGRLLHDLQRDGTLEFRRN